MAVFSVWTVRNGRKALSSTKKVMERQEHQQEREQAFLISERDCFAIYQVSRDDPQNVRFMNLEWLSPMAFP